MKERSGIT